MILVFIIPVHIGRFIIFHMQLKVEPKHGYTDTLPVCCPVRKLTNSDKIDILIYNKNRYMELGTSWPGQYFLHFQNAGRQGATRETITGVHSLTEYSV